MNKILLLSSLCVTCLYVSIANAQENISVNLDKLQSAFNKIRSEEFTKIDEDKNGTISIKEYQKYLIQKTLDGSEQSFANMDVDKNKELTKDEYVKFGENTYKKIHQMNNPK